MTFRVRRFSSNIQPHSPGDTMNQNSAIVTCDLTMECLDTIGQTGAVEASFRYDPSHPFEVTVDFRSAEEVVPWTFARDLLRTGRFEPSGEGDVLVHPGLDENGRAVTVLVLHAPSGSFVSQVFTGDLESFLCTIYGAVPAGRESSHLDLDGELASLFA